MQLLASDLRTYDVITGHENAYANNSWQKELEWCARCHCVCLVMPYRLICSMTCLGHSSDQRHFTWPQVRFSNWPFDIKIHVSSSMSLDARNTMTLRFFPYIFTPKDLRKNVDITRKQHFCLTAPRKIKMWPKVVKSGMDGLKTSQTFRSSLLWGSITIRGNELGRCPPPLLRGAA